MSNEEESESSNWKLYKGISFSCLSGLFFSFSSVIFKYLKDIHPGELGAFRFLIMALISLPLVIMKGNNPFGPKSLRHWLFLRGIFCSTALFLQIYAFQVLPIVEATVIIFSVPIFVSIFAWLFLKERCGIVHTVIVMLTMLGLTFIAKVPQIIIGSDHISQPLINATTDDVFNSIERSNITSNSSSSTDIPDLTDDNQINMLGVLVALSSNIFMGADFIVIRKAKEINHNTVLLNMSWIAFIEMITITALMDGLSLPVLAIEWFGILFLGIFGFCGQALLTLSLQLEMAGPVSVVRSATDITLSFIWQIFLFGETTDVWSISGALLVTACVAITGVRKWVLSLPEDSKTKSRLSFMLV